MQRDGTRKLTWTYKAKKKGFPVEKREKLWKGMEFNGFALSAVQTQPEGLTCRPPP